MGGPGLQAGLTVLAFASCPATAYLGSVIYRMPFREAYLPWAGGAAVETVFLLACHGWPAAAAAGLSGLSALLALYLWCRDWWRRNGKRVRKWAGAKSRALIDGLAGKMRDAVRAPGQVPA